jgi:hypothetical protein
LSSVASQLGNRTLGAGVINEGFAVGRSCDERSDGGIVEHSGETVGDPMQACHSIVCEQRIFAARKFEVMVQVRSRFGEVHRSESKAGGYALIKRRENRLSCPFRG